MQSLQSTRNESESGDRTTDVLSVLDDLRGKIRTYVFWEGAALVVTVLGGLFWGSFLVDWLYFQFSRLELPRWFRAGFLIAGISLLAGSTFTWIGLRFFRVFRQRALALILERRFPELDDRLITAVEACEEAPKTESPMTRAMFRQTMDDATRVARQLDLSSVFDRTPLKRASTTAVVLLVSVLCLAVTNSSAMERWIAGYLNLKEGYWKRETELILKVVSQPGDRIREFTHDQYKHPKGSDLSLIIDVAPGKKPPEQIRFEARLANGRGTVRAYLTRSGDQPFRHTIPSLLDDAEIWITGGDYVNLRPYRVRVVQPPEVQSVVLNCLYPDYTGLNQRLSGDVVRTEQQVNGAQASLPLSTDFRLQVTANKTLVRMRLEGDAGQERWEIEFRSNNERANTSLDKNSRSKEIEATIILRSNEGRPEIRIPFTEEIARECWSSDRESISLPFVLASDGASKLPELLQRIGESNDELAFPLPLPPDSPLRVVLEDADDIQSTTPARFTINGIVDEPPIVTTELRGIGSSITRRARIPISGLLADDYGVVTARFDYKVDNADGWLPRRFQSPPEKSLREYRLSRSESETFERFDVQPLDLSVKQQLLVTVAAVDGCTVGAAHVAQGQKYSFTIVSDEELLSMLYTREINIRKRFEQIIEEIKQTRQMLNQQQERLAETDKLKKQGVNSEDERLQQIDQGLKVNADRLLQSVRKNAVETLGVQSSFEEIREELVNNAADTPQLLERLDDKIIVPLKQINSAEFPATDAALGLFRLALEKSTSPEEPINEASVTIERMIRKMELVLSEMRELAKFHEVVEQLKANIKAQQDLLEETKRKRKEKAIKDLE